MDASEAVQVYTDLSSFLHQQEMSWVLEQVGETIALGKPQAKQVKTYEERDKRGELPLFQGRTITQVTHYEYSKPTGPKADLTTTLEYTANERLLLLIKAIEQAIIDTADMEDITIGNLEQLANSQKIASIRFAAERETQLSFSISKDTAKERAAAASLLRQHLQQLRERVYGN